MKKSVLLVCVAVSCLTGSAVRAEELPAYHSSVYFPAQPLPWTAEVYADFGALLAKLEAKATLDPAAIRVTTAAGEALPTRFEPDAQNSARGVVRWSAPATPKAEG
ncbi:MAG: hypothetical protein HY318_12145, partial [Armatimonadetes bacterium]|nr:hypothetical protein [Armatimonadota bacterium]